MGAFIRRHRWLSASLMLVAGLIGWWVSGGIRGQLVAHFDVARGHYEILSLGFPAPWRSEYARILRERYGIELRVVAGCVVSPQLLAYTVGYNLVSMAAANHRFGPDIFRESETDAQPVPPQPATATPATSSAAAGCCETDPTGVATGRLARTANP